MRQDTIRRRKLATSHTLPGSARAKSAKPPPLQRLSQEQLQRAITAPNTLASTDILSLQSMVGNMAVQQLMASQPASASAPVVQTKLMVGSSGDLYEREADRVARQVVTQLHSQRSTSLPGSEATQAGMGSAEAVHRQLDAGASGTVDGGEVAPQVESSIRRTQSGGQPLPTPTRSAMEQAFGADFSGVRIHHSQQADALNRAIDARAFTSGQNIYFRQGEFNPGNVEGQGLLAHELTHVVQQSQGQLQRIAGATSPLPSVEDRLPSAQQSAAAAHALGQTPQVVQRSAPGRIHRCGNKKKKRGKTKNITPETKKTTNKNVGDPEEKFKGAYQMARTFHGTHPDNIGSILEQGLRIDKTGTGHIGLNSEYAIDEQVVHLGLDRETSSGYTKGTKQGLLRPFLPANRRPGKRAKMWGMKNYKPVWPEDVPRGEIVYDEKHRGGGAVWTGEDVPGMNIMEGKHEDLLDSDKLGDQKRLNTILETIGTHYETLYGENPPDQQELRKIYTKLVRERRLSTTDTDWFT